MKKAAVITVSAILFIVLLAVNYLLWDNSSKQESIQNLENQEESKQSSLEQVLNDYWNEQKLNSDLEQQVIDMQKQIDEKNIEINQLDIEKLDIYNIVGDKNTIIVQLQKNVDPDIFKAIVDEWIDNIVYKDYLMAYRSHNETDIFNDRADILFTRYSEKFMNIVSMEITEFEVRLMDNDYSLDEVEKNRIVFDAIFNIELAKDDEGFPITDPLFRNGITHYKVTMAFDQTRWQWIIWTIE